MTSRTGSEMPLNPAARYRRQLERAQPPAGRRRWKAGLRSGPSPEATVSHRRSGGGFHPVRLSGWRRSTCATGVGRGEGIAGGRARPARLRPRSHPPAGRRPSRLPAKTRTAHPSTSSAGGGVDVRRAHPIGQPSWLRPSAEGDAASPPQAAPTPRPARRQGPPRRERLVEADVVGRSAPRQGPRRRVARGYAPVRRSWGRTEPAGPRAAAVSTPPHPSRLLSRRHCDRPRLDGSPPV